MRDNGVISKIAQHSKNSGLRDPFRHTKAFLQPGNFIVDIASLVLPPSAHSAFSQIALRKGT
jgi:hypothetical protein